MNLIGSNGADKAALINLINGLDSIIKGQIFFKGEETSPLKSHQITRLGIARTYQNIRLLEMLVWEHVMVGRHKAERSSLLAALFLLPHERREEQAVRNDALDLAERLALTQVKTAGATELSYGD